jgi:hypothetical protein
MSAKWIRSKQWDDAHFPAWAWPAKAVLRAFSSIPLAVVLLSLVVLYAILASVPAGLMVLGLTYLFYAATLVAVAALVGVAPVIAARRLWRARSARGRTVRFVASVLGLLALTGAGVVLWNALVWPRLAYDPAHGTGVRFFAGFVEAYKATTLRRLPGMEMSELEFYSWWPLRVVLLCFVLNMVTATVRRIEFVFPNIGVLMVHTGIVVIALGSVYYSSLKREGDTILFAGPQAIDGEPTMGDPQQYFYDGQRVVLGVRQPSGGWELRPIKPPRYNDYNLGAGAEGSMLSRIGREPAIDDGGRKLDAPVPARAGSGAADDLTFRVVGYASYADPVTDWVRAPAPAGGETNPVRFGDLVVRNGEGGAPLETPRTVPFSFLPARPDLRLAKVRGENGEDAEPPVIGLEYTRGMPAQRWADLSVEIPGGARHALVVEVPAAGGRPAFRAVYGVQEGDEIKVGQTGYTLSVKQVLASPPFPIITEGYRGATSSVAVVRVSPPSGKGFERWVYHRFPEIDQDLSDELNARGMPTRRDASPEIRIAYIDASKLQVYIDEPAGAGDAPARALVRVPGRPARVVEGLGVGAVIPDLIPGLDFRLGERWAHAEPFERPDPTPVAMRRGDAVGTHAKAMLAVEATEWDRSAQPARPKFTRTVWLPFERYLGLGAERVVAFPDDRQVTLTFGREVHQLPGFLIQLADFQMIAYDHRGAPRDYQSVVRVVPMTAPGERAGFEPYIHTTRLNAPLQAPFLWSEDRPYLANVWGLFTSRLNPNQYKFSQAGWDQEGWARSQREVDQGLRKRPYASFTILGVGNNPGIHVIAFGAVLMSVGIPWAFYVKPLILKRRKAKLAKRVAAGTYQRPARVAALAESAS